MKVKTKRCHSDVATKSEDGDFGDGEPMRGRNTLLVPGVTAFAYTENV